MSAAPGLNLIFSITFHPRVVTQDIRYPKVECKIEGSKSIFLTLTGSCVNVNQNKEAPTLFQSVVRGKEAKHIIIKNPTNQKWVLKPMIDGPNAQWWTGPDRVVIEPQVTKPVEFVYRTGFKTLKSRFNRDSVD